MDMTEVANIINIVTIILVVLFFLGLVLSFLIGWKRGLVNSLYRFCFMGGLAIIALFCAPAFAKFLGTIDLLPIFNSFGYAGDTFVITNTATGESATILISNALDTLTHLIEGLCELYDVTVSGDMTAYATNIALSLLALVGIIISSLLIVSVGGFLCILLWHLIFKRFFPKRIRRSHKKRWLGAIFHVLRYVLITCMCALPTISIVNIFAKAYQKGATGNSDNQLAEQMNDFISVYNNSAFSNIFFNWTSEDGIWSFDSWLMDYFVGTGTGDTIYDIISQAGRTGGTIISNGIITDQGFSFDIAIFADADLLIELLESFSASDLIVYALPLALSIAMNQEAMKDYIDPSLVESFDFNVQDEINNLQLIVSDVYDSGFIDAFIEYDINNEPIGWKDINNIDIDAIYEQLLATDSYGYFMRIFDTISRSELLSNLIPIVLYSISSSGVIGEDVSAYLPDTIEQYKNIDWGKNLAIIYDSLYELNELDPTLLSSIIEMSGSETSTEDIAEGENTSDLSFVANLLKSGDELKRIIVGETDQNNNPIGVDEYGRTITTDSDGNWLDGADYCLFDSDLIRYAIDELVNLLTTNLNTNEVNIDMDEIDSIIANMNDERAFYNFKKEFGALLESLSTLGRYDSIVDYLLNPEDNDAIIFDNEGNIVSIDDEFIEGMEVALPTIDNSKLLSVIIPDVIKGFMDDPSVYNTLLQVGLDSKTFDWEVDHIGEELSIIFSALDGVFFVNDSFNSGVDDVSSSLKMIDGNEELLLNLFESFYISNIINPKTRDGTMRTMNFYNCLGNIYENYVPYFDFDSTAFEVTKWTNTRLLNGDYVRDRDGNILYDGELGYIINFFDAYAESGIYDALNKEEISNEIIGELETTYHISKIFSAIDMSEVTKSSIGDTFDYYLSSTGIIDIENGITFNNIVDWSKEGQIFGEICTIIGKFTENINEINIFNVDYLDLRALLDALVESHIFVEKSSGEFLFPIFVKDKIQSSFSSLTGKDYFIDPDGLGYDEMDIDFSNVSTKLDWKDVSTRVDSNGVDLNFKITELVRALSEAKNQLGIVGNTFNPSDILLDENLDDALLRDVVLSFNDVSVLRIPLYHMLNDAFDTLEVGTLKFDNANTSSIITMNLDERKEELNILVDIISDLKSFGFLSSDANVNIDTIANDSPTFKNLLVKMYDSTILNTFEEGYRIENSLTSFENVISYVVTEAGLNEYIDDKTNTIIGVGNKHADASSVIEGWLDTENDIGEISRLIEVIIHASALVDEGESLTIENLDDFFTMLDKENGVNEFSSLLHSINDSRLLYSALPNALDTALTNANSTNIEILKDVDFSLANVHYRGDIKYESGEIDVLVKILLNLKDLENVTFTSIDSIDEQTLDLLEDTMLNIHSSKIFHRAGPKDKNVNDETLFQNILSSSLDLDEMNSLLYNEKSPKDVYNRPLYSNASTKMHYLVHSAFPSAVSNEDWSWQVNEINELFNTLSELKKLDIDWANIDTIDYRNVDMKQIESAMLTMNRSSLLYDGVPNILQMIVDTNPFSTTLDDFMFDLNKANVYYHYQNDNYDVPYPEDEIVRLTNIMTNFNLFLPEEGTTKDISLSYVNDNIDLLRDILVDTYQSNVFNTFVGSETRIEKNTTVYEDLIDNLLATMNFREDVSPVGQDSIDVIISIGNAKADKDVAREGWLPLGDDEGEIERLLMTIQSSEPLMDANGYIAFDTLESLLKMSENESAFYNLLIHINDSRLLFRTIPNHFDEAMSNGDSISGLEALSDLDFSTVNVRYQGDKPYPESEISAITAIMNDLRNLRNSHFTNLSELDLDLLEKTFIDIHSSNIFHRAGPNANSFNKHNFLQTIISSILKMEDLQMLIYNENSPKDVALSNIYTDGQTKAIYLADLNFPYESQDAYLDKNYDLQILELQKVVDVFRSIKSLNLADGNSMNVSLIDFSNIGGNELYELMSLMNDSDTLYDGVTNVMNYFVNENPFTNQDGINIDLKNANIFYHYRDGYEARYDAVELHRISEIIDQAKLIMNIDIHSISNLSHENNSLIIETLKLFHDSNILHAAGPKTGSDVTMFIDVISEIYDALGLSSLNYDENDAGELNANDYQLRILNNYESTNGVLNDGSFIEELDDFKILLDTLYDMFNGSTLSIEEVDDLNSLITHLGEDANTKIFELLDKINNLDTLDNILPSLFATQFNKIPLSSQSSGTVYHFSDLFVNDKGESFANYDIGQMSYKEDLILLEKLFGIFLDTSEATPTYGSFDIMDANFLVENRTLFPDLFDVLFNIHILDEVDDASTPSYSGHSLSLSNIFELSNTNELFLTDNTKMGLAKRFYTYSVNEDFNARLEGTLLSNFLNDFILDSQAFMTLKLQGGSNLLDYLHHSDKISSLELALSSGEFDSYFAKDIFVNFIINPISLRIDNYIKTTSSQNSIFEGYKSVIIDATNLSAVDEKLVTSIVNTMELINLNHMDEDVTLLTDTLKLLDDNILGDSLYSAYYHDALKNIYADQGIDFTNYEKPFLTEQDNYSQLAEAILSI